MQAIFFLRGSLNVFVNQLFHARNGGTDDASATVIDRGESVALLGLVPGTGIEPV